MDDTKIHAALRDRLCARVSECVRVGVKVEGGGRRVGGEGGDPDDSCALLNSGGDGGSSAPQPSVPHSVPPVVQYGPNE